MKKTTILFFFLLLTVNLLGQDSTYSFDLFKVQLDKSKLEVRDEQQNIIYRKTFFNPNAEVEDLDGDGVDEYLITDYENKGGKTYYSLYVFNTIDSFYVADSINSGLMEPYPTFSQELKGIILVSGNSKFDVFNSDSDDVFLPLNCWKYENGQLFDVNDELYDYYISENDTLIDYIDSYLENNSSDCNTTDKLKAVLASVYANYLNAGEKILANQFLRKYYFCKDVEVFKQKINMLL